MIDVPDFGLGGRRSQVSERRHARDDEEEKKEQEERLPACLGWLCSDVVSVRSVRREAGRARGRKSCGSGEVESFQDQTLILQCICALATTSYVESIYKAT